MLGQVVSHYKIIEKLGEGGMGIVYSALDPRLDRIVALKFLPPQLAASDKDKARLLQEAKAAAALNHPNVCSVFDIQEHEGQMFIVMEFIEGNTLRAKLDDGPIDIPTAAGIARQIAEGLRAAHAKGMVHRDIKPENVIITVSGIAKIADFGLAALTDELQLPESRSVAGTTAYMSPEQANGDRVDHLTDIWSLGVTLYEMVSGVRPFSGAYDQAVAYLISHEKHPPVSGLRSGIPPALEKIIDRCLEKNPAQRFPDAGSLSDALQRCLESPKDSDQQGLKSIAVLPFSDISPGKDNAYFSEGLTEEIIANLSKLRMVRVVSRTSVANYDRAEKTMKQIAGDLSVQYILEGSVRKHGSDIRITTHLIDASQDTSLWSEKYGGTMEDIFDIQETVAAKIVKALRVRLTPREKKTLKRRSTKNADAYQLYLKGRFFWNKRNTPALQTSIRYFKDAIRKDEKYALAWTGLADAYSLLSEDSSLKREETYPKAREAVEKAIALDDQLAEAHASLASVMMLWEWDWENSGKEFRRAIELKPNYATAHHWYSEWFLYTGRIPEAIAEISHASLLDPLSPAILKDKGMTLYYAGQYDAALEEGRKTLELDPGFAQGHRLLSLAYQGKKMYAEAFTENRKWEETGGARLEARLAEAQLLAVSGKKAECVAILKSVNRDELDSGAAFRCMALVHTALGEPDLAFQWLEKAYALHAMPLFTLKIDPKFAPLRTDPRYQSLMKKVGLES